MVNNLPYYNIIVLRYFGNPTVRAVSKLCRASMQITLKVKSSTIVSDVSPTLSLLSGSSKWLRILTCGTISIVTRLNPVNYADVSVTCSLFDLSKFPQVYRHTLIRSFIKMVCIESRCQLDVAEHECLMCLMLFLVNTRLQPECGIESNIDHYYGEFRTVPRWNMCYASAQYYSSSCLNIFPSTLIEHMMLGNFTSIPSIAHYVP